MGPKPAKAPKSCTQPAEAPKEQQSAKLQALHLSSRPYQDLKETKGLSALNPSQKAAYATTRFLEIGAWKDWSPALQSDFWKSVEDQKIPIPFPEPTNLGKDKRGKDLGSYTPEEYKEYKRKERVLDRLRREGRRFRELRARAEEKGKEVTREEIEEERARRMRIAELSGEAMGFYGGNPEWDDVVPIPQDDGEGALAAIAYNDEYAEAMSYLRALLSTNELSPRALKLTTHIITLNAAHYTVWLFRFKILRALNVPLDQELEWLNDVALDNLKNYQIWHHRQLLIEHYVASDSSQEQRIQLARQEVEFMDEMFHEDAKNYHVWSYRAWLVKKLGFWGEEELRNTESWIQRDVRNNSAWSHRFFLVFNDPGYCTEGCKATEVDPGIPRDIVDREMRYAMEKIGEAPQNQSPWNYLRGILRKGGRELGTVEGFAVEFARIGEGEQEEVNSSHALDLLADIWAENGERGKADTALRLLGEKYDRIRRNYWEWKREQLNEEADEKDEK